MADVALQTVFLLVVGAGIVLREELRDSSLQLVGVVVEDGVFGDVRLVFVVVGESAEVHAFVALDEGVALHDLVV